MALTENGYHDRIPKHEEDSQYDLLAGGHRYRMSAVRSRFRIELRSY